MDNITNNFKEEVEKIKRLSIVDFCDRNGIELKKSGRYYSLKEHNSLVIDTEKNNFIWNSRQKNGDIINFVQEYYNVDFKEAITIITNKDIREITNRENTPKKIQKTPEEIQKNFEKDLEKSSNMRRVYAYLTKKRNINPDIINEFVKKDLIIEDNRHNLTFKMYDKNEKLIGVAKKETGFVKLNYINPDSDIKGFSFKTSDAANKLYFFEAPIDLMSFYEMNRENLKDSILISMQGVKHNCVEENIKHYNIKDIALCVDNDDGGKKFIQSIKRDLNDINIEIYIPETKDWNEDLKYKKEKELFNLSDNNIKISKISKEKYLITDMKNKKSEEFLNIVDAKRFVEETKKEHIQDKKKCNNKER